MTRALRRALVLGVLVCFLAGRSANAQGLTDYKPGAGAGPVTGSASGESASGAAPTLERCSASLGTIAVAEPQDFASKALQKYNLPSPTGLIRLLIQQSGCFLVVERGVAMQNILQERQLMQAGELRQGAQMGQGQLVTADYVLTPDVVFSENSAGGIGAAVGALGSFFGIVGTVAGAVASGLKFKQAQTSMIVADTRTGLQVAAAQGSVEKADWGLGGALAGGSAVVALGAYESTAEGKVVSASFLDNWNNIARAMRGNPTLQKTGAESRPELDRKSVTGPSFERGDVLVGKIGGVRLLAQPSEKAPSIGALSRTDEVIFLGQEVDGFLYVQGERGAGWVEKLFLRKSQ